jgi:hypothetical protein
MVGFFMRGRMGGMRFRKLGIAWSAVWGLAAVLLIVLWLRSYSWVEVIKIPLTASHSLETGTMPGLIGGSWRNVSSEWVLIQRPVEEWRLLHKIPASPLWGGISRTQSTAAVYIPYWPLVLIAIMSAGVPWRNTIGLRFSLRTLLIATTLVALILGLIVYGTRQ